MEPRFEIIYPEGEDPERKPEWACDYYYYLLATRDTHEVSYRSRVSLDKVLNLWADSGRLPVVNIGRVGM